MRFSQLPQEHPYEMQPSQAYEEFAPVGADSRGWLQRNLPMLFELAAVLYCLLMPAIMVAMGYTALGFCYFVVVAFGTTMLFLHRKTIVSPRGMATLFFLLTFALPVPFFVFDPLVVNNLLRPGNGSMTQVLWVGFLAYVSFCGGTLILPRLFRPAVTLLTKTHRMRPASYGEFFFLLLWAMLGIGVSLSFSVGRAAVESEITTSNLAGLIQFLFRDCSFLLFSLFFYRALSQGVWMTLCGVVLFLCLAIGFLLLGWKGALVPLILMMGVAIWIRAGRPMPNGKRLSLRIPILLLLLVPTTISVGYRFRAISTNRKETTYFTDFASGSRKVVTRVDGNARLAAVLEHEGMSMTNNFKFIELYDRGMIASLYADREIFGISRHQQTSTGASGPGGAYILAGILGVISLFSLLGGGYQSLYNGTRRLPFPELCTAFYIYSVTRMSSYFSENFLIDRPLKVMFVMIFLFIAIRVFYTSPDEELQQQ